MMFPSMAIVRRDLLRAARQKRTFFWLVALVGLTSVFVAGFWPNQSFYYFAGSRISQSIILPSVMTWMFAVMILVTPYGATAIVLERQRETLDLVRTTRIRPLGFIFAQLLSVLSLQLLLLLSTVPVVASIYFLVGLELRNFALGVGMVLVVMVSCAVAGLYASSKSRTVLTALVWAYVYAFVLMGGPVFAGALILDGLGIYRLGGARFEEVLAVTSPAFAGIAASIGEVQVSRVAASAIIQGVVVVAGLVLIYRNVRRPEGRGNRVWELLVSGLRASFPHEHLRRRLLRRRRTASMDSWNPVYVKDTRFVGDGHRSLMIGLSSLLLAVAVCIAIPAFGVALSGSNANREEAMVVWVVFMWFALGILAPLTTATSIANEHELGNLDMLRVTRLSGRQVALGKFLAGCRMLLPAFVIIAAGSLVLAPLDFAYRSPGGLTTGFVSACLTALLGASLGILASSFARTSTRAVIWAYMLTAGVTILLFLAGGLSCVMLQEVGMAPSRNSDITKGLYEIVCFLSPPLAFIRNYNDHNPHATLFTPYWVVHTVFYVILCFLIVLAASLKMTSRWRASDN